MAATALDLVEQAVRAARGQASRRPFVVGLCGAQGSGKSTVAAGLAARIGNAAVLSLDDLYLTRAKRVELAATVHPLLATRGVPGTHDVALGLATFAALDRGEPVRLPRFDKAIDDRADLATWPTAERPDVVVFEGWCVGARPQPEAALDRPINTLEAVEDAGGRWRRFVDAALSGPYQAMFARVDLLILLAAPGFEVVAGWRREQEAALRRDRSGAGVMTDAEVARFVAHYERLTRWILDEMPGRADLTIMLDADRAVAGTRSRGARKKAGG